MRLECNVGGADRIARIGLGTALIGTGLLTPMRPALRVAAGTIGAVSLVTGLTRYCPASHALGVNTCPEAHETVSEPVQV